MLSQLRSCTAFVLDMDGTIYVDERLLPGARELIDLLETRGHRYVFVTNNSSRRGVAYQERLARLGIHVPGERILTSGDATIDYIKRNTPHRSCYLVGTPALEAEFREQGITLDEHDPDCVVVGYDSTVTFQKLEIACRHLFAGKPYFATHPDRTCITERGLIPDIAAIIAACEAVTRRLPKIIGKPEAEMVAAALHRLGATAGETAIVGDQLDTDMAMGLGGGLVPVLVMTGETTPAKLESWPATGRPRLIARGVDELVEWLR